jgi:hypothetical protein
MPLRLAVGCCATPAFSGSSAPPFPPLLQPTDSTPLCPREVSPVKTVTLAPPLCLGRAGLAGTGYGPSRIRSYRPTLRERGRARKRAQKGTRGSRTGRTPRSNKSRCAPSPGVCRLQGAARSLDGHANHGSLLAEESGARGYPLRAPMQCDTRPRGIG